MVVSTNEKTCGRAEKCASAPEVSAREDGLGILEGIHLCSARLLAELEVLEDEVAGRVQLGRKLLQVGNLPLRPLQRSLDLALLSLGGSFRLALVGDRKIV